MNPATNSEELLSFHELSYACTLMAQTVVMGIIEPMADGREQARHEELNRAFDIEHGNRPYSVQDMRQSQDAHEALQVAYTEHEEPYDWRTCCENWTYREQRWAIDPRFFDPTTDLGWSRMHLLKMYIAEACPGQRNFDPAVLLELPPENLKEFDWQHFPGDGDSAREPMVPSSQYDPNGSMMAVDDDSKWQKAQALVDERLAGTIMEHELKPKPLPKGKPS